MNFTCVTAVTNYRMPGAQKYGYFLIYISYNALEECTLKALTRRYSEQYWACNGCDNRLEKTAQFGATQSEFLTKYY
jgi:hypothetical protein